jgi:hypothetical protein
MVRRYNNNPSIFSRTRRPHHHQPQYAPAAAPAYREPGVLSRGHRRGFGRRRAPAPMVVEEPAPVMTSDALPPRRSRFGRGRRQRAMVVEEPVVRQRRRTSLADKIAGALMRLQGTLTRRPGLKVRF